MRRSRQWVALLLAAATCAGALTGCGKEEGTLTLSVCAGSAVETFDPAYLTTNTEATVLGGLYENLMRLSCDVNGNTVVAEGIAKSVNEEENFDGTVTYTFRLRSAHWSDGRDVTADDFVYAWQRLANPLIESPNASMLSAVQGYAAVRAGADPSELAVVAKNDSTLEVTLSGKYEWFLSEVCTAPATSPLRQDVVQTLKESAQADTDALGEGATPLKWWHDPTRLVTNGTYRVEGYQEGETLDLTVNQRYHGSARNDGVHFVFASDAQAAWALYEEGAVDFVSALPEEQITALQAEGQWAATPVLATYSVAFNGDQQPLDDPAVRKALSLAVDRQAVAALAGATGRAAEGLVPYGVSGDGETDFRTGGGDLLGVQPEDYEDNCKQAKTLLAQSGYDDLYELEYLYVDEGASAQIAQELTRQWRAILNVKIKPKAVTEEEMSEALRSGEYNLAGVQQIAQFNDAEAFLAPFSGRSTENVTRYANSAYDTLLSIIDSASDVAARQACLHDAEALLLDDGVVSPLYTTGTAWKLREGFTGLCRDARGWFHFAEVAQAS